MKMHKETKSESNKLLNMHLARAVLCRQKVRKSFEKYVKH